MNIDQNTPSLKDVAWIFLASFLLVLIGSQFTLELFGKWNLVILEGLTILPALFLVYIKKWPVLQTFRIKKISWSVAGITAIIGLGVSTVVDEIDRLIQLILPMDNQLLEALEETVSFQSMNEFIPLFIAAVIMAGIIEEMLFRGILLRTLESRMDVTNAVIISALLFTVIHMNPWWAVQILILGVILGVLSWRTKSIIPGIIVHGINNTLSLVMMNQDVENFSWYEMQGHVAPMWIFIGFVFLVGGFHLLYLKTEKSY